MKRNDFILSALAVIFFVMALFTKQYIIRGIGLTLLSVCYWLFVYNDPNGRIISVSQLGGFWFNCSKKTIAIISSVGAVIYWIMILIGFR
ncbi:MAG: hypothetical protein AB7C97_04840 [Oscillospiraceae bacterium]